MERRLDENISPRPSKRRRDGPAAFIKYSWILRRRRSANGGTTWYFFSSTDCIYILMHGIYLYYVCWSCITLIDNPGPAHFCVGKRKKCASRVAPLLLARRIQSRWWRDSSMLEKRKRGAVGMSENNVWTVSPYRSMKKENLASKKKKKKRLIDIVERERETAGNGFVMESTCGDHQFKPSPLLYHPSSSSSQRDSIDSLCVDHILRIPATFPK